MWCGKRATLYAGYEGSRLRVSVLTKVYLNWFRLAGTSGVILFSSLIGGIATARALGVAALGLVTIIQGITRLLEGTVGIQSYNTLIKLGTNAASSNRPQEFVALVKSSLLVELVSQSMSSAIAFGIIYFLGQHLGLSDDATYWGVIAVFGSILHSTWPLAVLRIFDKFFLVSVFEVSGALLRLFTTLVCAYFHAHPAIFLAAWLAADIIANFSMMALATFELRRQGYPSLFFSSATDILRSHKEFWHTIFSAKVASTLRMITEQGDILLVGAVLGPTAVGYLRIAKTISFAVIQLAWPIHYVSGPTLTNYWSSEDFPGLMSLFKITIPMAIAISIMAFIPFYFAAPWLLTMFYGAKFAPASDVTIVYVVSSSLTIVGFAIMPTMYAMGRSLQYMYIHVICFVAFWLSVYLLLPHFGLLTTGIAHAIYQTIWLAIGYAIIGRGLHDMQLRTKVALR